MFEIVCIVGKKKSRHIESQTYEYVCLSVWQARREKAPFFFLSSSFSLLSRKQRTFCFRIFKPTKQAASHEKWSYCSSPKNMRGKTAHWWSLLFFFFFFFFSLFFFSFHDRAENTADNTTVYLVKKKKVHSLSRRKREWKENKRKEKHTIQKIT